MATNYPGGVDAFDRPAADAPMNNPSHSAILDTLMDAIEAVETELGITPSGAEVSVADRLAAIEASGDVRRVLKSADQTLTTDTLTDDADLQMDVVTGRSYVIEGLIIYSSSEASGITFDWGLGATPIATVDWTFVGENDATLDGGGVGVKRTVTLRGTVTATGTGTIPLKWAQATTEATPTDTTVHAGSHLEIKRLY